MDGVLVDWKDANIHVMSYTLHYGSGVFEGIRSYPHPSGTLIFRLKDHIDRLLYSAKVLGIDVSYSANALQTATVDLIKCNRLANSYIRPLIYLGSDLLTLRSVPETKVAISNWDLGNYVKKSGGLSGISTKVSSYNRFSPNSVFTKAKITGNYVNTTLAIREAMREGYDEAILLSHDGYVAEGSCENIFCVRNNILYTPFDKNILPGLTRDSVIQIAKDNGIVIEFKDISRDELYSFEEIFLVATAAEIVPVRSVDGRVVGDGRVGSMTNFIANEYSRIVSGDNDNYSDWLSLVCYE